MNTNHIDNRLLMKTTDPAANLKLSPETRAAIQLLAPAPGNQLEAVEEVAQKDILAVQGGARAETERALEFAYGRRRAEERHLRDTKSRLNRTEPKIIQRGQRIPMGFLGWFVVLVSFVGLMILLWIENGAAAQALLSTGMLDVTTLGYARTIMATPIAVGIGCVFLFKMLPPLIRSKVILTVGMVLAVTFLTWVLCFAIQTEKFRDDAQQGIALGDDSGNFSGEAEEIRRPEGGWSAWLMFASLVMSMALTTCIAHLGLEHYLKSFETWITNPDYKRLIEDVQAQENEGYLTEKTITELEKRRATFLAEVEQAISHAKALYKSLKQARGSLAAMALMMVVLAGCTDGSLTAQNTNHLERWANQSTKRKGAVMRVLAISPRLSSTDKSMALAQLEAELTWIAEDAPVGSMIVVIDGLACVPVARLQAVPGVSRIRKKALRKPALAIREFLRKSHPRAKDDGRIHFPRLAQIAKQWRLPAGSHVVVLGNPLFLSDGKDAIFSMTDGRVPSDGCLFEEPSLNIYSIVGREKALAGQFWHLGWSDDSVFEDDTHRQAVLRFWYLYFQGQSAQLVTAQPSFAAAAEAAREGATDPLMHVDPTHDEAAMVKIMKVEQNKHIELKPKAAAKPQQSAKVERAAKETKNTANAESAQREATNAPPEKNSQHDLINLNAKKAEPIRDQHGNVKGADKDLIADGQMTGQNILIAAFYVNENVEGSPLKRALATKGFNIEHVNMPLPPLAEFEAMLAGTQQLWLWSSSKTDHLPSSHRQAIVRRWREGKLALCLLADNSPFTCEASAVLNDILPGSTIHGEYRGEETLHARSKDGSGFDANSPLFHNIVALYEGTTISSPSGPGLTPVCYASNGSPLVATFQQKGSSRLVVHGGFTSFYQQFWDDAGVSRFAVNCAGWLNGVGTSDRNLEQPQTRSTTSRRSVGKPPRAVTSLRRSF